MIYLMMNMMILIFSDEYLEIHNAAHLKFEFVEICQNNQ